MSQELIAAIAVGMFAVFMFGYALGWRHGRRRDDLARRTFAEMREAYDRELDRVDVGDIETRVRNFQ